MSTLPADQAAEAPATGCCAVAHSGDHISREDAVVAADLLKAVADPVRLQLLSFIRHAPDQEACVCDLTDVVGLSQPTVSHHLKRLVDAGLLSRERRGTWSWYGLVAERLDDLARSL